MLFSSIAFIYTFLPIVFVRYFIDEDSIKVSNFILLISSIIFYWYGELYFVKVMMLSIICNYLLGFVVANTNRKIARLGLYIAIFANLSLLFVYKYLSYISQQLSSIENTPVYNIALPIGISFFTFQALSYVIDVYRGDAKLQRSIVKLALYISFFPQLVAGPIVRYNTIERQIDSRKTSLYDVSIGFERFLIGLFKKVLIANNLAQIADFAFDNRVHHSTLMMWVGLFAYAMQIYYDFSGYSDMAIGLARVFGFKLEENFNLPYMARSVSDFWRRWHISLGTWFRDYLYIPLGGSRCSKPRIVFNLLVVWTITGIWHGAGKNFAMWGLCFAVFIIFEKLSGFPEKVGDKFLSFIYRIFILLVILLSWVLFRSVSLTYAINYYKDLFFNRALYFNTDIALIKNNIIYLLIATIGSTTFFYKIYEKLSNNRIFAIIKIFIFVGLFLVCTSALVMDTHNPFIYFKF